VHATPQSSAHTADRTRDEFKSAIAFDSRRRSRSRR
jgi:hypothetical protein